MRLQKEAKPFTPHKPYDENGNMTNKEFDKQIQVILNQVSTVGDKPVMLDMVSRNRLLGIAYNKSRYTANDANTQRVYTYEKLIQAFKQAYKQCEDYPFNNVQHIVNTLLKVTQEKIQDANKEV